MIEKLTKDNFDTETNSTIPVIVDFYADWCGPCKVLAPILESLSEKYDGNVKVFKVNIMDEPEIAARFEVRSIPYLVAIKGTTVVDQQSGFNNRQSVEDLFERVK